MLPPSSVRWPAIIVHLGLPPSPWNYTPWSGKNVEPRDVGTQSNTKLVILSAMQSPPFTVLKFLTYNLFGKITSTPLPSVYPTDQLPQVFSDFFVNKVQQVHDSMYRQVVHFPFTQSYRAVFLQYTLCGFETVTQETVLKCMKQMSPKHVFLTRFQRSYCLNLWSGCSSAHYHCKSVLVYWHFSFMYEISRRKTPFEKKTSLDPNVLKNFRPVSNLSFVSKLIEKLVLDQLFRHLDHNNLWHTFQSAYRPKHSAETALRRVLNDLLTASDSGSISSLTLPDLSAAFHTIYHGILLTRLDSTFGIRDLALSSFRSYL